MGPPIIAAYGHQAAPPASTTDCPRNDHQGSPDAFPAAFPVSEPISSNHPARPDRGNQQYTYLKLGKNKLNSFSSVAKYGFESKYVRKKKSKR